MKAILRYAELLEKVQGLLVGCKQCRNIRIDSIELLHEPADGANWVVPVMRLSGDDNDMHACKEFILGDLRQLRSVYDLDPATMPR
jgi:hypothetical protein